MDMLESEFAASMARLGLDAALTLGIACSGGPDSQALLALAGDWARPRGTRLIALIVDHGLRPESAAEARQCAGWAQAAGHSARILRWEGAKPTANIQEAAREARYRLLAEACREEAADALLTAHHQDDQAETVLLRLARGSGVDGLSAMKPLTALHGIRLARPLLGIRQSRLRAYLAARNLPCLNDPGNENPAFDRVKMRRLLPQLEAAGLTVERLAGTAQTMTRVRQHLERATREWLDRNATLNPAGFAVITPFEDDPEITLRGWTALVACVGGAAERVRLDSLVRALETARDPSFTRLTLGGCILERRGNQFLLMREAQGIEVAIPVSGSCIWDHRYRVDAPQNLSVGALGQKDWLELAERLKLPNPYPVKRILYTLPALRDAGGNLLAVPHLGICDPPCPPIRVTFLPSSAITVKLSDLPAFQTVICQ